MKILGISDIHGQTANIEKIKDALSEADLALLVGDITNFGGRVEIDQIVNLLKKINPNILSVSGNCDNLDVEDYLTEYQINLNLQIKTINQISFVGMGGSLTTPFNTPNEYTDSELSTQLNKIEELIPYDNKFIFVSHQPPYNTACDKINSGLHVGSQAVRKFIEKKQPIVCFTGHIHESKGIDKIGNTIIINPAPFWKNSYAQVITDGKNVDSDIIDFI